MRVIDQLVYKIDADNSGFNKGVAQSEKKAKGFSKAANVAFTALAVGGATMLINKAIQMGKEFVSAASDAEETANKFNVTFSDIRDEADATAQELADSFGLSSQKSQQLLSDTGDLLTGFGFTQESALDLSEQVNELAVDLASFTNYSGGAEGASAALTKALLGERESIKTLGIAITEADINRLAEDKGIEGELTRQQKAMLTLELATTQSKNAIGDFERSQDSLANQQRILEGNIQDLRVELGNKLLPTVTTIVSGFNDLLETMTGNGLNRTTSELISISKDYQSVVEQLEGDTDDLTESERTLLEVRRSQLELKIREQVNDLADAYGNEQDRLQGLNQDYIDQKKIVDGMDATWNRFNETDRERIMNYEYGDKINDEWLKKNENIFSLQGKLNQIAKDRLDEETKLLNIQEKSNLAQDAFEQQINSVAEAVRNGVLDINNIMLANKELGNAVQDQVDVLKAQDRGVSRATDAFSGMKDATDAELNSIKESIFVYQDQTKSVESSAYQTQLLALINEELTSRLGDNTEAQEDNSEATDDTTDKTRTAKDVTNDYKESMKSLNNQLTVTGDTSGVLSGKINQTESSMLELLNMGVKPSSEAYQKLASDLEWYKFQLSLVSDETRDNTDATKDNTDGIDENSQEWEAWADIASQSIDTVSNMIEDFSGETISQIGSTVKQIGEQTGDATAAAAGAVLELGGQIISFFDDMEERNKIWAENMKSLSYDVAQTEMGNKKMSLDYQYEKEQDHLDKLENLAIQAAIERLSEEEQQALKSQGYIHETKMERLQRELDEAKENNDEEQASVLENAIEIQNIRDEYTEKREEAEKEYNQKIAQYEHDKAVLDKQIAISQAEIAKNKAIADLGWFNWNKKDEVRGLYSELIGAIESTPLPPIPSFDVGSIRVPETTQAIVHKNEMILTAPQAEQARSEGVTISPTGGGQTIHLVVELDGKVIGESTLDKINSGQLGKISTRIVK